MKVRIVTEPAAEPVTLTEAKAWCRVTSSSDDTLLTSLITAARVEAERFTGRAFITQTLEAAFDAPRYDDTLTLPRAPVASVTSVKLVDDDGGETTVDTGDYHLDAATPDRLGRIVLSRDGVWPLPGDYKTTNAILVRYTAGYGASGSSVPEPLKMAIRELIRCAYDASADKTYARSLMQPYRIIRVAG